VTSGEFVESLHAENQEALERLGALSRAGTLAEDLTVSRLLRIALKNELEATEVAAIWLATTPELDVKLALARQVGDEAKHYRLISERLEEMDVDASQIDPREGGYSKLFHYLSQLASTVQRVAAGHFTREGIALVRNESFIEFCLARGDKRTAALYKDVIQKDEWHHHETGRRLLERYALDEEQQAAARLAARKTIQLAEEIQEMARIKAGIGHAPGC
jgi:1,2-phenylacetyl-CoA epoxidase catalytic subunit